MLTEVTRSGVADFVEFREGSGRGLVSRPAMRCSRRSGEDEIREITDYGFVRVIWDDLYSPRRTLGRFKSRMRIAS